MPIGKEGQSTLSIGLSAAINVLAMIVCVSGAYFAASAQITGNQEDIAELKDQISKINELNITVSRLDERLKAIDQRTVAMYKVMKP